MTELEDTNVITYFEDLDSKNHCSSGFQNKLIENSLLFYRTVFEESNGFQTIIAAILLSRDLRVKLQCNGCPLPLPKWFIEERNAKPSRFSMLENFPSYIAA